jgi:protein ImuB
MEPVSSRRYLALWLRRFSTDLVTRRSRASAESPLAIVGAVKNARRLVAVNDAAARMGLRANMSFADACAIYPALDWAEDAPGEAAHRLTQLADWCERYTPLVGLDAPDGLLFDITGVAHLFGGEAALARDAVKRFAGFGFHARIGIAATVGAAWAAAHYGKTAIVPSEQTREGLASLPLGALRLPAEIRGGLVQLGLKTVRDIMDRPRGPLVARFGAALMRRLDQALGCEEEPITPRAPVAPLSVEQGFPEPLMRDEDLLAVLLPLLERLCAVLEKRGQGARRLRAAFFGVDGKCLRLEIGTSRPLRESSRLHRLFTDKFGLTRWDNEFGIDRVRVCVLETEARAPVQTDLSAGEDGPECAHLIDRLSARLGEARVLRLAAQDTHVPEQASVSIPAASAAEFAPKSHSAEQSRNHDALSPTRPIRLFERPEVIDAIAEIPDGPPVKFRWRRMAHEVARVEGPERIAMPWWRDGKHGPLTRDYFRVETESGVRLWLYRDGLYSETGSPRWFCHGFLP